MIPEVCFSDISPEETARWAKEASHTSAALFLGKSEYEPWADVIPCAYIFTKQDGCLPYPLQHKMAQQLGPNPLTAEIEANHCPFLSKPQELLSAIDKFAAA